MSVFLLSVKWCPRSQAERRQFDPERPFITVGSVKNAAGFEYPAGWELILTAHQELSAEGRKLMSIREAQARKTISLKTPTDLTPDAIRDIRVP